MSNIYAPVTSVESKSKSELSSDIEKAMRCMGKSYIAKFDYDIGEGVDMEDYEQLSDLKALLCSPFCEVEQDIKKIKNLIKRKVTKYGL